MLTKKRTNSLFHLKNLYTFLFLLLFFSSFLRVCVFAYWYYIVDVEFLLRLKLKTIKLYHVSTIWKEQNIFRVNMIMLFKMKTCNIFCYMYNLKWNTRRSRMRKSITKQLNGIEITTINNLVSKHWYSRRRRNTKKKITKKHHIHSTLLVVFHSVILKCTTNNTNGIT